MDSHIHLADPRYEEDLEEVLTRGRDVAVRGFLLVACDPEEYPRAASIAESGQDIVLAFGCHPHIASRFREQDWQELERWLAHPSVVALGECGLDYHYMFSSRQDQRESLHRQIALSKEKDLPLIVHTREAEEDTVSAFQGKEGLRGVFHCFTGSREIRNLAAELDFYLGAAGMITFRSGTPIRRELETWPLERLLLETDGPYLAPIPHRGQRNEPCWIPLIGEQMASLLHVPLETVAQTTTQACQELFRWCPGLPHQKA